MISGITAPGCRRPPGTASAIPSWRLGSTRRPVRLLALELGLGALSELPSAPCLSSRIETGIRIEAPVLAMVHAAEILVGRQVAAKTVRCRVRAGGVVIELDQASLAGLDGAASDRLTGAVAALARDAGLLAPVTLSPYRTGSAFLRPSP